VCARQARKKGAEQRHGPRREEPRERRRAHLARRAYSRRSGKKRCVQVSTLAVKIRRRRQAQRA
jgi:hypothetical protein